MNRIIPGNQYLNMPCSVVAVGCALHGTTALNGLFSNDLHNDGYLSLKGMNALARANLPVKRFYKFKRGERPTLEELAKALNRNAIICVLGHFLYVEGNSYYSFFENEKDQVVAVWEL